MFRLYPQSKAIRLRFDALQLAEQLLAALVAQPLEPQSALVAQPLLGELALLAQRAVDEQLPLAALAALAWM